MFKRYTKCHRFLYLVLTPKMAGYKSFELYCRGFLIIECVNPVIYMAAKPL